MPNPLIDPEVLASLRELQTKENPTFLKDYLITFLEPIPNRLTAIDRAISNKDFQKLQLEAHALKSSCANTGIATMTMLCEKLEKGGKTSSLDGIPALLDELKKEFELLKSEIHSLDEFKKSY